MAGPQPKHINDPDSASPPPKQFLALDGIPILIHSLRAFAAVERVTAIYVAVRKPEMERVEAQVAEYGFASEGARGGRRRQPAGVGGPRAGRAAGCDRTTLCWCTTRCGR